jgi:hypothetical protein
LICRGNCVSYNKEPVLSFYSISISPKSQAVFRAT